MGDGPYQGPVQKQKEVGFSVTGEGYPGNRKEPAGASPTPFIKKTSKPGDLLTGIENGAQGVTKASMEKTAEDVAKLKKEKAFGYGEPNLGPMYVFTDEAASKKAKQGETHGIDH